MPRTEGQPRRKRQRLHDQTAVDAADEGVEAHGTSRSHSQDYEGGEGAEDGPACQSCRRRKSRCSKQQPCGHCQRLQVECTYDERRRPGFKTGAIEALSQRVANLEQMFLGQALLLQGKLATDSGGGSESPGALVAAADDSQRALLAATSQVRERSLQAARQLALHAPTPAQPTVADNHLPSQPPKMAGQSETLADAVRDDPLPSEAVVQDLVNWYFKNIHQWIPVLHQRRFRENLHSPAGR